MCTPASPSTTASSTPASILLALNPWCNCLVDRAGSGASQRVLALKAIPQFFHQNSLRSVDLGLARLLSLLHAHSVLCTRCLDNESCLRHACVRAYVQPSASSNQRVTRVAPQRNARERRACFRPLTIDWPAFFKKQHRRSACRCIRWPWMQHLCWHCRVGQRQLTQPPRNCSFATPVGGHLNVAAPRTHFQTEPYSGHVRLFSLLMVFTPVPLRLSLARARSLSHRHLPPPALATVEIATQGMSALTQRLPRPARYSHRPNALTEKLSSSSVPRACRTVFFFFFHLPRLNHQRASMFVTALCENFVSLLSTTRNRVLLTKHLNADFLRGLYEERLGRQEFALFWRDKFKVAAFFGGSVSAHLLPHLLAQRIQGLGRCSHHVDALTIVSAVAVYWVSAACLRDLPKPFGWRFSDDMVVFKVPHGAPAASPHGKRSSAAAAAASVDGIVNNSPSSAYAAGLQAAAAAAIGLGHLADLSAVYRQATSDQASNPTPVLHPLTSSHHAVVVSFVGDLIGGLERGRAKLIRSGARASIPSECAFQDVRACALCADNRVVAAAAAAATPPAPSPTLSSKPPQRENALAPVLNQRTRVVRTCACVCPRKTPSTPSRKTRTLLIGSIYTCTAQWDSQLTGQTLDLVQASSIRAGCYPKVCPLDVDDVHTSASTFSVLPWPKLLRCHGITVALTSALPNLLSPSTVCTPAKKVAVQRFFLDLARAQQPDVPGCDTQHLCRVLVCFDSAVSVLSIPALVTRLSSQTSLIGQRSCEPVASAVFACVHADRGGADKKAIFLIQSLDEAGEGFSAPKIATIKQTRAHTHNHLRVVICVTPGSHCFPYKVTTTAASPPPGEVLIKTHHLVPVVCLRASTGITPPPPPPTMTTTTTPACQVPSS
ncbi:unnamed protein product [Mesocestoides corti]|uniref:Uncharacterized protein n=1 Tax=Mesocestoides corti TaxID=53468 RepID=A0A0R3UGU3_MESCO|nr:unnamed protein product [Mesocestoides corti]